MKKLLLVMVFALGSFSIQAGEITLELVIRANDCADYAENASRAEYYAYTPIAVQALDYSMGWTYQNSEMMGTYSEWLAICEDYDGEIENPVFV